MQKRLSLIQHGRPNPSSDPDGLLPVKFKRQSPARRTAPSVLLMAALHLLSRPSGGVPRPAGQTPLFFNLRPGKGVE
jgi:hypothetical protein